MKRLIRKAEPAVEEVIEDELDIGDSVPLDYDAQYEGLDMDALSRPEHRDGAVLIDTKENVVRWGLNGETHDQLFDKYYSDVITDTNALHYETDEYVVPGVYLKKFMGYEAIILYNNKIENAASVIQGENPGIRVYFDDYFEDVIERIASSRLKKKAEPVIEDVQVGEEVNIDEDPKYEGITIDEFSRPSERDGAVIVDVKANKLHWGTETHSVIVQDVFGINEHDDEAYDELDNTTAYGVYLKDFLGNETIILYGLGAVDESIPIIQSNIPGVRIYVSEMDPEKVKRLAKRVG